MSSTTPFGNGRRAGNANTLYFTAGIPGPGNIEDHGLFGSIQVADSSTAPKAQASPVNMVNIINFALAPPTITVAAGTQVQWTNQDGEYQRPASTDGRHAENLAMRVRRNISQGLRDS